MKKLFIMFSIGTLLSLVACKDPHQTGGAVQDNGAAHGSQGPTDSSVAAGSGSPIGTSTGGTDTTNNGKGVNSPTVDSMKH